MRENLFGPESLSTLLPVVVFVIAFLLGSIPFGLLIGRIFKVSQPTHVETVSELWPAGVLTFLLDFSKGVLAVLLAMPAGLSIIALALVGSRDLQGLELWTSVPWASGLFVVLGHCYSPWSLFRGGKGGKGVATALGVIMMLSPLSACVAAVGFVVVFFHRRIVALASISGVLLAAVTHLVLNPVGAYLWLGVAMLFVVLLRHESSIDALLEDREPSMKLNEG